MNARTPANLIAPGLHGQVLEVSTLPASSEEPDGLVFAALYQGHVLSSCKLMDVTERRELALIDPELRYVCLGTTRLALPPRSIRLVADFLGLTAPSLPEAANG